MIRYDVVIIGVGHAGTQAAVPWFWSNQYDLKLQTVGLSMGYDRAVRRGSPAARSFWATYVKQGRALALDCVNMTRNYVRGRKRAIDRARIDPARLADAIVPLKTSEKPTTSRRSDHP